MLRRPSRTSAQRGSALVAGLALAVAPLGCSSATATPSATDDAFLSEVHSQVADIGQYRSDTQLIRLGHVVCDDFSANASYQEVADRLSIQAGADSLPAADLGAVITSAADNYCPRYRSQV